MKEYILEANVLVHFLTRDQPHQARAAASLLHEAEAGEACLLLDPVIIAEALHVLRPVDGVAAVDRHRLRRRRAGEDA